MSTKNVKIFVDESEQDKRRKVETSVYRVLATYPDSITAEVDDAQAEQLKSEGFHLEPLTSGTTIKLHSIEFDPTIRIPAAPRSMEFSLTELSPTEETYWIVQFSGPVKPEWVDKVKKLGGEIGDYIPENAFLVQANLGIKDQVSKLDFVRAVVLYQPAYKISSSLMGFQGRITHEGFSNATISAEAFKPKTIGNLRVLLHKEDDTKAVMQKVESLGGTVIVTDKKSMRISLDPAHIVELARLSNVQFIEQYVVPKLFNDITAGIIGVQPVWNNHGLDGEGQIVAVADTGLDTGVNDATMHADFRGRVVSIHSWPVQSNNMDDGAADRCDGHGTHVAGSILGSGAQSNGEIRGMAYKARLVFQAVEQYFQDGYGLYGIPNDLKDLFQQSYDDGARIFSNSWGGSPSDDSGNPIYGQYSAESQAIDEFIWNHKDAVILFAAGNEGKDANKKGKVDSNSLAAQATAKNCITVGASENYRPSGSIPIGIDSTFGEGWPNDFPVLPISTDHVSNNSDGMAAFSSRGPTADGRIKPDVVAPGTNILSVRSSVDGIANKTDDMGYLCSDLSKGWGLLPDGDLHKPYYKFDGGTSMATPITAGAVALIRQYLQKEFLPNPSAALIKAVLIHGAVPMKGQYMPPEVGAVPNNDEGWGRININQALFPADPLKFKFKDSATDAVGTGDQRNYTFTVVNTSVPFRTTLVWTDSPNTPASAGGLINQLSLSIIAPDGTTTQGGPSNNNVQQVVINKTQMGTYTVRITGITIPTESKDNVKQDFALVVTAGL